MLARGFLRLPLCGAPVIAFWTSLWSAYVSSAPHSCHLQAPEGLSQLQARQVPLYPRAGPEVA